MAVAAGALTLAACGGDAAPTSTANDAPTVTDASGASNAPITNKAKPLSGKALKINTIKETDMEQALFSLSLK